MDGPRPVLSADDIVERYYPSLQEWAMGLSRGDEHRAEDIVHDLCLHLSLTKPDLSRVENLDGYLYTALRHLYLSHLARSSRDAFHPVTNADYDFIELAFLAHRHDDQLFHQNELRRICAYVMWRKASIKSASYFILQFFYELEPREVAEIACLPIKGVWDKVLKMRAEIKAHLALDPDLPQSGEPGLVVAQSAFSIPTDDLFRELKQTILSGRRGDCPSSAELLACYCAADAKAMSCALLDHVVSCEACLAEIQSFLRVGSGGPTGLFGGTDPSKKLASKRKPVDRDAFRSKVNAHRTMVFAHRPTQIVVAVDGRAVASQAVAGQMSVQSVRIEKQRDAAFVEVFSEQGMRLAYMSLGELPPTGPQQQSERISLSDGRWLKIALSVDALGIYGRVEYFDPNLPSDSPGSLPDEQALANLSQARAQQLSALLAGTDVPLIKPNNIKSAARGAHEHRIERRRADEEARPTIQAHLRSILKRLAGLSGSQPLFVSAAVCSVAAVVFLVLSLQPYSHLLTAPALLERAETAERTSAREGVNGVIVQIVRIRTAQGSTNRTIYRDVQGKRHAKVKPPAREQRSLREGLELASVSWDDPLSAESYRSWRERQSIKREFVRQTAEGLMILTTEVASAQVASESIAVRLADFHPVGRTVELRDRSMFEITELDYQIVPWRSVVPDVFDDDNHVSLQRHRQSVLPHLSPVLSEDTLDMAELSARVALNRLHLDTDGRLSIARHPDGVWVTGLVGDDDARRLLRAQLQTLPHVRSDVRTLEEMKDRPQTNSVTQVTATMTEADHSSSLETYIKQQKLEVPDEAPPAQVFVDTSFTIKHESEAIALLAKQFSANPELRPASRAALNELLLQHRSVLLKALAQEEGELKLLKMTPANVSASEAATANPVFLQEVADQNFGLCVELTSGKNAHARPAEAISPQLMASISNLRSLVLHLTTAGAPALSSATPPVVPDGPPYSLGKRHP